MGTCLSLEIGTVAVGKTVGAAVLEVPGAAQGTVPGWSHILDNGKGTCIRDRGNGRHILHNGSGWYLLNNNNKRILQDGCGDEHRDVRILRAEAL